MRPWVSRPRYRYPWSEILLGNAQLLMPPDSRTHFCPHLQTRWNGHTRYRNKDRHTLTHRCDSPDSHMGTWGPRHHRARQILKRQGAPRVESFFQQQRYKHSNCGRTPVHTPMGAHRPHSDIPGEATGSDQKGHGLLLHTHSPAVDLSPSSNMHIGRCSGLKTFTG